MTDRNLQSKKFIFIIILNVIVTIAQIVGGIIGNSLSLITDALHNVGDIGAILISFIAIKLFFKKHSYHKTFGYKRAEIIAAFVNTLLLIAISINIVLTAFKRLSHGLPVDSNLVIILAIAGIIVNGLGAVILYSESKNSLNIRSSFFHLFADAITSVVVLVGGLIIYHYNIDWIDSLLSIIIGFYLTILSLKLMASSLSVIMQFAPKEISVLDIEKEVLLNASILNIHHIHLWQMNESETYLEAHVELKEDMSLSKASKIIYELQLKLKEKFKLTHILLAPEIGIPDPKGLVVSD